MIVVDNERKCKCPTCGSVEKKWLTQETIDTLLCLDFYECQDCKTIYAKPYRAVQPNGLYYQEIKIK
jgi:uncharacterized Zn finger protein